MSLCVGISVSAVQHPHSSRLFSGESPHHDDNSVVLGEVYTMSVSGLQSLHQSLGCNYIETPDTFIMSRIMRLMAATIQP